MKKIKTAIMVLLFVTVCFACSEEEGPMPQTQIPVSSTNTPTYNLSISGQTFTYLALGDSYTIGQGVEEEARWPIQLKTQLSTKSVTLSPVDIIAQTGWTTDALLRAIDERKPQQYDLVSLLIGVNNQYQKKPFSQFETEFKRLLNKAISLAGGSEKLFVVSIPDYSVTRFGSGNPGGISSEINGYNGYIQQQCIKRGILFVDVTYISREMGSADGALAGDGLHPSREQYGKWVERILPEVIELLENKNK